MMTRIKQMYKDFFGYRLNEAAYVPYNIMDFAKNKGSYAVALVKKAATWAEKSGKRISGGTAIGKNYSTIILDMKHQGAEIYINLDNETIELYGEEVYDAKSFAQVFKTMSDPNNIIFSINDEKLDDILRANHSRELEYKKDVTGDVYYILPIKEFDRFIDYADSAGYNVDHENSEDSVIYVADAEIKLREQNTGTISTKDPKQAEELAKKGIDVSLSEDELAEAQLVNNLTDYRGGIEYVVRDPQTARSVMDEIQQWSTKKGFNIIKSTLSKTGRIGYIYYRLGQDPALESQKLQGYLAQKPELKHFRFNVRGEQQTTRPAQQRTI
jgi:hypothetical protein